MFTETLWFHMTHAILWVQFFAEVCIYGMTYAYIHTDRQTEMGHIQCVYSAPKEKSKTFEITQILQ